MGRMARERVLGVFSPSHVAAKYLATYDMAMRGSRG
jgi:hypothetical protein